MANGASRAIAPARKFFAVVLGAVATFVVLFGLGMTSWSIVALGVALVAVAVALGTLRTGGGRAWVVGAGHVHGASEPPTSYSYGRCELQILVDAPGLPPRTTRIVESRVPVAKWPTIGQTLPIRVALDDQRRIRVLWDEVPTHAETAATVADVPPEYATTDPLDEVLIQQDAPPWAERGPDDDHRDTPPADPLVDEVDRGTGERETVVVHQRPGGPVVLEGTLVDPTAPTPRRTAPTPRPPAEDAPPRRYGDPYAGPPDEPYPPVTSPYRDPYADPPGDPDLDRPASPYGDPYAGPPGEPYPPVTSPYRDPYADLPATGAATTRTTTADAGSDAPTVAAASTGTDEPTEPVRFIDGGQPATSGPVAESTQPADRDPAAEPTQSADSGPAAEAADPAEDPTVAPTRSAESGPAAEPVQPAATDEVDPPAMSGPVAETPVVTVRQRTAEPVIDPVDIPLDDPEQPDRPSPAADTDPDEVLFGTAGDGGTPISGVGITVLVTDLDRSLSFYRDTLGFQEIDRGPTNAVLASGSTRLVLREVSQAAPISRRLVHVNLEVDDIEAAYERLRDSGIRFTYAPRVVNRGSKLDVWAAAFRDPDGHGIALTQWRTRAEA